MLIILTHVHFSVQASQNTPLTYEWTNLRSDTAKISYSFSKAIWYGGTGYLHIKANGTGVYEDTKTTTATITIPEGFSATVYVCGDDRNPIPNGWFVQGKYLRLYVDGKNVYELGKEYWFSRCYSKAATLGPGTHSFVLTAYISVKVTSNSDVERDVAYAAMEIRNEGGGSVQAISHGAEAVLDGIVTHSFAFRLPEIIGVEKINWKVAWNGMENKGDGAPGSVQTVSFIGLNRGSWAFTSSVVIKIGDQVPSIEPTDGFSVDAFYSGGSEKIGAHDVSVAINNGDEVGFTSGKYLVTNIEYLGLDISGHTSIDGLDVWANSGSEVRWAQKVRFYEADGWVVEEAIKGIETGSCMVKVIGGGEFSRKISFASKNRVDELILSVKTPYVTLHFDSMRAEPVGPAELGLHRPGEVVELKVKTSDCLGEYSRIDVYRVSESSFGTKEYSYGPVTGVYRGINCTIGENAIFKIRWSSYSLRIAGVSGGALREGKYWTQSGSRVDVKVLAYYSDDGSPVVDARIRDSDGNEAFTGLDGVAKFSYLKSDCECRLTYAVVDGQGNELSIEVDITIVFTSIRLEALNINGEFFEGSYYFCNDATASIVVKALYSHSLTPVVGALAEFKPSSSSASTDSNGHTSLRLTGRDKAYDGEFEVSDGIVSGSTNLRIIFTRVVLEASEKNLVGMPGEDVEVIVRARLTYNDMMLSGLRIRWIEGREVKETPASFRLKIPEGSSQASFEAVGFLSCVEPCMVEISSKAMKPQPGYPNGTNQMMTPDAIIGDNRSYKFMLNIMDLLNITIPKVLWYRNGSIAYGVEVGVVSLNGTIIKSDMVSERGVSFSWTESKPGIYHYVVRPLGKEIDGGILSIEAIFTAFKIIPNYILDLNDTHMVVLTAFWAHNNSPVEGLPVHTILSGQRAISGEDGALMLSLKDSSYNSSCIERVVVLKEDAHPSGIWRTLGDCYVKIVKLSWHGIVFTGDQYRFDVLMRMGSEGGEVDIPLEARVEGHSPRISSSIRILSIKSENLSMTIFIKPTENFSLTEALALRIERADYDGNKVIVGVRSLAGNFTIRNVIVGILNSTLRRPLGDLQPGSYLETALDLPEGFEANPIIIMAYSENTIPHAVKVWIKQGNNFLPFISIIPFLVALALRLRKRDGDKSGKEDMKNPQRKTFGT
ncbi:MAG: hypothetical protein ACUVUS_04030 [Thermoproteota archaeon]